MLKTLTIGFVTAAAVALWAWDAQAKSWWARCPRTCAAPVPAAACAPPPAAPQTTQAPGTQTYQSFSYEPGVAPPATTTRMTTPSSTRGGRFEESWRSSDHKATGRYMWNSR